MYNYGRRIMQKIYVRRKQHGLITQTALPTNTIKKTKIIDGDHILNMAINYKVTRSIYPLGNTTVLTPSITPDPSWATY